ncbi:hypothetical protein COT72_03680 [archaeon CG10_big_fil_rev_8_21_14_0_10_43_11]|nr:MAG: hypothetical protein COT72_03680 [archaeon CG10_big_fil_rev_8_21_14_0_10_43_11]
MDKKDLKGVLRDSVLVMSDDVYNPQKKPVYGRKPTNFEKSWDAFHDNLVKMGERFDEMAKESKKDREELAKLLEEMESW